MPTMADITIKKNDGTTDVVYVKLTASGGDKSPAIWRLSAATGTNGQKPELRMTSQSNAAQTGRSFDIAFTYPEVYTDVNSVTQVRSRGNFKGSGFMPADLSDAAAEEFGAQLGNLLASALIEESMTVGFAPA